jgi:hypothetical protein
VTVLRLLPVILSGLLLAAHFSRHGSDVLAVGALAFPLVLLVRRPWVPRLVQGILVVGALEWVRTGITLTRERQAAGETWLRMAVILAAVAAVTLAATLVFRSQALKARYGGA